MKRLLSVDRDGFTLEILAGTYKIYLEGVKGRSYVNALLCRAVENSSGQQH